MENQSASAHVQVLLQVTGGSWGPDCKIQQLQTQAGREAIEEVEQLIRGKPTISIVGKPVVRAIIADCLDDERRIARSVSRRSLESLVASTLVQDRVIARNISDEQAELEKEVVRVKCSNRALEVEITRVKKTNQRHCAQIRYIQKAAEGHRDFVGKDDQVPAWTPAYETVAQLHSEWLDVARAAEEKSQPVTEPIETDAAVVIGLRQQAKRALDWAQSRGLKSGDGEKVCLMQHEWKALVETLASMVGPRN